MANLNQYLSSSKNQNRSEERINRRKADSKLLKENIGSHFWQAEEAPESILEKYLEAGDVVNAFRAITSIADPELRLGIVVNIIDTGNVAALETFLRLGYVFEIPADHEVFANAISNSENKDIVYLAHRYKMNLPVSSSGHHEFQQILKTVSDTFFSSQVQYASKAQLEPNAKALRFGVGQLQTDSHFFEEYLPSALGLVPWLQRFDEIEVRELLAMVDDPSKESELLVTLSRRDTSHQKSALHYISDIDTDNKNYSWNIAEVWSIEILTVGEFLRVLGRCKLLGVDPFLAFNVLDATVFDEALGFKTESNTVHDQLAQSADKLASLRARWNN